jgi:hypothetical protein
MHAGLPQMREKVIEATQAHQQGSAAQDYALAVADVLEGVLLGRSIPEAVQQALLTAPVSTQVALRKAQQHAHATQTDVVEVRPPFSPAACTALEE